MTGAAPLCGPGAPLLRVSLPFATPSLNVTQKWHPAERKRWKARAAWEIKLALSAENYHLPASPLPRARLRIERSSPGNLDFDNLVGGAKLLIDLLLPMGSPTTRRGKTVFPHPFGLGIVADDSPACLTTEYLAARGRAGTTLTLWEG